MKCCSWELGKNSSLILKYYFLMFSVFSFDSFNGMLLLVNIILSLKNVSKEI